MADAVGIIGERDLCDLDHGWTTADLAAALVAALALPEVREALADVLREALSEAPAKRAGV